MVEMGENNENGVNGVKTSDHPTLTTETVFDKLSQLVQSIDSLTQKVDSIDERTKRTDERLERFQSVIDDHGRQIEQINGVAKNNFQLIKEVKENIAGFDFDGLSDSVNFVSQNYDSMNTVVRQHVVDIKSIRDENTILKQRVDALANDLQQERVNNNKQHQYFRTSVNVKLCGVPCQPGEDEQQPGKPSNDVTKLVIASVCRAAHIAYNPKNIDVCHRIGSDAYAPIIIRFATKSERFGFWNQRGKLEAITSKDLDFSALPPPTSNETSDGATRGGLNNSRGGRGRLTRSSYSRAAATSASNHNDQDDSRIYMQEHLTNMNKNLLKEAKNTLRGHGFKFPGYVKGGQVRAKLNETSNFFAIESIADIQNIVLQTRNGDQNGVVDVGDG